MKCKITSLPPFGRGENKNLFMLNIANLLFKKKKDEEKEAEITKEEKAAAEKKDYTKELEEKITVHVMPERFRTRHIKKNNAKSMGIVIIALGILLFGAIGFGLYFFLFKSSPAMPSPEIATTTESGLEKGGEVKEEPKQEKTPINEEKEKTPTESYQEMKAEFDKIKTFSQLEEISRRYGSQNKIKEMDKYIEEAKGMPEEFKNNIVALLIQQQIPKLSEIGDIKEEIIGDKATLDLTGKDLKKKGVVILIKEGSDWKLESENWSEGGAENNNSRNDSPEISFTKGADSDSDGLTDKEELVLGSDSNLSDSDGDGYADLAELKSLYNPNGAGKIGDNPNIASYANTTNKYNLIYPKNWSVMPSSGDSSIIFKASDNHFIQIITQTNTNKESISAWYSSQFGIAVINDSDKIAFADWQGIRSEDGLTVYLTDAGNNNIYTITYNIGIDNILEYKNIFDMLVASFNISK